MSLTICVASWSNLLSDYKTLAASSVDELQLMSTYARPSNYESIIDDFFEKVEAGGDLSKAGVGIGIYYDGRGGYPREWNQETAQEFVDYVSSKGGTSLDIFVSCEMESTIGPSMHFCLMSLNVLLQIN